MITPTRHDIGRRVVYRRNGSIEAGVITSLGTHFVFVRYGSEVTSKATLPADLDWEAKKETDQ